jgi:YesN/AraC family two-component response regulator
MLSFENQEASGVYRLIFVDDEDIVREGISTRIPWGEINDD